MQNKIHDLKSLHAEKERLKIVVNSNEQLLKHHTDFFQSNYKTIIWEKVNPFKEKTTINEIIKLVAGNILPLIVGSATQSDTGALVIKGIANAGASLFKKITKRKEKQKEKKNANKSIND